MRRLVAVLGYSRRGDSALTPICAARLARAEEVAEASDTVVLSGRGRVAGSSEASLMAAAWTGRAHDLVLDHDARSTVENARAIARHAALLQADELVLVTSSWHRPRAAMLLRAALRGSRTPLRTVATPPAWPLLPVLRELVCLAIPPLQMLAATRKAA